MKTTIEIPDAVYKQVKARAALKGQTVRSFLLAAVQERLAADVRDGKKASGWRAVFGKARASDVAALQSEVDAEFSRIRSEDWM